MESIGTTTVLSAALSPLVEQVCRYSTQPAGFGVIDLGEHSDSTTLRRVMVEIKNAMSAFHRARTGRLLNYFWLGRFNQQTTTKFHRDNAPEESILLLGYEPTTVPGRLFIADYSKVAERIGWEPQELLEKRNPMFAEGETVLADDVAEVRDYRSTSFQIVAINNSNASLGSGRLLGVLHKAEILKPDPDAPRIINSVMLAAPGTEGNEWVTGQDVQTFLQTETVSERNY